MIYKLKYNDLYLESIKPIKFGKRGLSWVNMDDLKKFICKHHLLLNEYKDNLEAIGFDAITLLKYNTLFKELNQARRIF